MKLLGLFIQRAKNGFDKEFLSNNLTHLLHSEDFANTSKDERTISARLSNQTDVYTFQSNHDFKVYSFVKTNITDSFGRAGCYVIRLYVPKNVILNKICERLQDINNQYLEFLANNTPESQQNYDSLLEYEDYNSVSKEIITIGTDKEAFFRYETIADVEQIFKNDALYFIQKLYCFDKEKAVAENIIQSFGLLALENQKNNFKKVTISDPNSILKDLKVDKELIAFKSNELVLYAPNTATITYNTTDEKTTKTIFNNYHTIEKKVVKSTGTSTENVNKNKETFWQRHGEIILISFLCLILISIVVYTFDFCGVQSWFKKEKTTEINTPNDTISKEIEKDTIKPNNTKYEFEVIEKNNEKEYTSKNDSLKQYTFKYVGNKWSFKNANKSNQYVDFYKETVKDFGLKPNQQKEFIEALEKISTKEIKEKPVNNLPEKNIPNTKNTKPKPEKKKPVPNTTNDLGNKKDDKL